MTHSSAKHFSMILIIILGVMTAFGPLTIDTYTPSYLKYNMILELQLQKSN